MKKVCIIIGHGGNDFGAWNKRTKENELEYNTDLAKTVAQKLKEAGFDTFAHNRGYGKMENIGFINSNSPDVIISLHCNAATGTATGTEMLHWHTSKNGKKLASCVQEEVLKALGLRDRGIKEKKLGDRGAGLLKSTKAPCIILEPFFIDNDNDLKIGKEKKNEYAEAIVNGIVKYFEC